MEVATLRVAMYSIDTIELRGLVESRTLTLAGRWVTNPNPGGYVGLGLQSPLVARVQYDVFMQCVHRATKQKEMSGG